MTPAVGRTDTQWFCMNTDGPDTRPTSNGTVRTLPPLVPATLLLADGDEFDHPMRTLTEDVAHHESSWTPDTARSVESVFDRLAPGWDQQFPSEAQRLAPLVDALDRGGDFTAGVVADIGAGTAVSSDYLRQRFRAVVGFDLSFEMLRLGSETGARVQPDAGRMPLPDDSLDAIVLMNAFLFPTEVDRVLRDDGVIIFVSSMGPATPIYLSTDEIVAALPGEWGGVRSAVGFATWAVLRRM